MATTEALLQSALDHYSMDRIDQATAILGSILATRPKNHEAHRQMAVLDFRAGRISAARAHIEIAARNAPDRPEIRHLHAFLLLHEGGAVADRARPIFKTIGIDLETPDGCCRIADDANNLGDLTLAQSLYRAALALDAGNLKARLGLTNCLFKAGLAAESMANLRAGLGLCSDKRALRSVLAHNLTYSDAATAQDMHDEVAALGMLISNAVPPSPPHTNTRDPDRPLRIGYLTQDLGAESAIARFIAPALIAHDRANFHITCYCTQSTINQVSPQLKAAADCWLDCESLSDDDLVALIRANHTDIVVELAGHTYGNRPLVVARRPAPVQITFIGDAKTTGMPAIDCKFVDANTDPPGAEAAYTERLIRLDDCFLCYQPPENSPEPRPPSGKTLTFASFNASPKVGPEVVALWSRILQAVPDSTLLLKMAFFGYEFTRKLFRSAFASHGIDPARIRMLGRTPAVRDHLAAYSSVDIALDPFPYNGTTTTCDALWMAVPVITLRGRLHAGRVGASLLTAVGLPDLIAETPDQYVEIAKSLAANPARRATFRKTLRAQMAASPLGDMNRYAKKIDAAYRRLWQEWCAKPPS